MKNISELKIVKNLFGAALLTLTTIGLSSAVYAENVSVEIEELKRRILELEAKQKKEEEKTEVLAQEVEKNRIASLIPEKAELKSEFGLGPAASSVYRVKQGLSIGGYGEGIYTNFVNPGDAKKDQTDLLRLITYFGYKFNDSIIFNSEIEFEHGTTSDIGGEDGDDAGSVSVEFAYLDFLTTDKFNTRVGNVLVPLGFVNEIHEPPYFHGVQRPYLERSIIPSTFRENGFGFFGKVGSEVEYRTYVLNGLRATRFQDSGMRDGRQSGNRALVEDFAWTARVDYTPVALTGFTAGAATFLGNAGQDEDFAGSSPSVFTQIHEVHAQYRYRQFEMRALGAISRIDDADVLSTAIGETIPEQQMGWYVETAYNLLPHFAPSSVQYLAPFVRYESVDLQDQIPTGFARVDSLNQDIVTVGLTYKPLSNVVLKFDYRNYDSDGLSDGPDEISLGFGFAY
jgi:hypothetical protein